MKFRIQLALMALAALAIMVAACSQTPTDHYPTFSQAMNHLVGAGNWSAKSHANGSDDLLTVSGVTIKLPGWKNASATPAAESELPVYTGSDGTVETSPSSAPAPKAVVNSEQQVVEIATVEIKKPLDQKTLGALIAAADWKNQKETKLADSVVLKGINQKFVLGGDIYEATMEEAGARAVTLSASGADAPAGRAGFLKALRLSGLDYKNFVMSMKSNDEEGRIGIGQVSIQTVAFDGEPLAGIEAIDPSGLTGVMTSMSAKSASVKDVSMDIQDERIKVRLSVALVDEKDIKAVGAIGEVNVEGMAIEMVGGQEGKSPMTMSLARLNMRGFDMSSYMRKIMPVVVAASLDPDQADKLMLDLYTLGDLFVSPFSLDEVAMSGLEADLSGLVTFKMAEAKASGSYRAGQITVAQKSSLSGLEIILPENDREAADDDDTFKNLYEFGQKFGMTRFVIDSESEGAYDAASGQVVGRLTRLTIKDLLEISGSGEMGGLTAERVEKLNKTPLSAAKMALIVPDETLGDVAIHNLNIKVEDKGLINRLLAYAALVASESGGVQISADDVRQQVLATVPLLVTIQSSDYLANPETLVQSLTVFLKEPGSLEIKMAAQPPLGLKSILEMGLDQNQILNSLNLSLSANGQEAQPLKFAITR